MGDVRRAGSRDGGGLEDDLGVVRLPERVLWSEVKK